MPSNVYQEPNAFFPFRNSWVGAFDENTDERTPPRRTNCYFDFHGHPLFAAAKAMMFDEDGMVLATEGLPVPHPWEVRKSATYLGKNPLGRCQRFKTELLQALHCAHNFCRPPRTTNCTQIVPIKEFFMNGAVRGVRSRACQ